MDKNECVSTGLGKLVNYGDSDSDHEEIEVVLIDKDGDKFKQKKTKAKKRKTVGFLTAAITYKQLRNSGIADIDEAAMKALKELSPEDRRLIPPMTNTIKESQQAFWMKGSAPKKMDTT